MLGNSPAAATEALPVPDGEVVLVIDGAIGNANVGDEAHFDMAMLQALPADGFVTDTPTSDGPQHFEGVTLADMLAAVEASSAAVLAVGVDDYAAELDNAQLARYPVLIAYRHNGEAMSIRDLGPLRIVFPYTDHPELRTNENEMVAVWQLIRLTVQE